MADLHRQLCRKAAETDFIGVTINSEKFNHGPLWLSFRPVQHFTTKDLWEMLFSAVQSTNEFNISDRLDISCALIKGTVGSGRTRLTEDAVNKKSILTIRNNDNLCLPRSLVTAYAYAVRGQIRSGKLHDYWNSIRQSNGRVQKEAAEELVKLSKVKVPLNGCGIPEIKRFQDFFSTRATAIVVYNFSTFARGHSPLYDGTQYVNDAHGHIQHTLRIMYYERMNHFQPILNLVGASGSNGYCIPCNKKYSRVEDHRCSNRCYKCMASPQCAVSQDYKNCSSCFRSFFGNTCYENHLKKGSYNKTNSVCDKIKTCQLCYKTVRWNIKKKHECGVSFCNVCKLHLPNNHLCYVQPLKIVEEEKALSYIYLFYDFETQQSTEMLGDEEKKIHIPNLCIVQQVCTFCIDNTDISINCDQCGIREYVFKNNPVKQLVCFGTKTKV